MFRTGALQLLDAICHAPVGQSPQPVKGEWRSRGIAAESFTTEIVLRCDADAGVHIEAVMLERPLACRRAAVPGHVVALIVLVEQCPNLSALHRDDGTGIERRASLVVSLRLVTTKLFAAITKLPLGVVSL